MVSLTESIASTSMDISMTNTMREVNVSTTKMAMDSQEEIATKLVDDMMPSNPSFGHTLDILV